ncbi:hypothetical protein AB0Q95_44785 [Streptomyces sp. NPDC059900]|uniref:hypothetical protein n=1 Tax=Streptomyces sp. NPDC059900 TaxID=3155816 RepID=UPI00341F190A
MRPHVITGIQTIPIPGTPGPDDSLPPGILHLIADLESRNNKPSAPGERQDRAYHLAQELKNALIAHFLPEVNPSSPNASHEQSATPTTKEAATTLSTPASSQPMPACCTPRNTYWTS